MKKNVRYLFGISTMLALTASFCSAEEHAQKEKAPAASGAVVTVDPKTREIRPATSDEIGALNKAQQASANTAKSTARRSGTHLMYHHTGAIGVALDDSFLTSMTATVGADGKVAYQCVEGAKGNSNAQAKKGSAADVK